MLFSTSLLAGTAALAAVADAYGRGFYKEKQFEQTFYDNYNTLKHNGGNGPYSDRESYGIDREPPAQCAVDQVIMLKRHGERYPDPSTGADFVKSLDKLYAYNKTYQGDLAFLNDWTYFVPSPSYYAQETFSGPYAGLLSGYRLGNQYRARYGDLWNGNSVVPVFSSGYERIVETAREFGEGFFGYNYSTNAALNIISENATQGADSLTPSCYHDNDTAVCDSLTGLMPQFDLAVSRFQEQNPGLNINASDVYYLMQMAAFELNARPFSPWIDAFTLDEWVSFGYTQDLSYYYCDGPGDSNMAAVGQVFVNGTSVIFNRGPKNVSANSTEFNDNIYFNFCHDTNITPVIAALGLLDPSSPLPTDSIAFGNPWSTGNIVPMGGHLVLERLNCNATAIAPAGKYIRAVLNEAVVPFPTCQNGPGYSCPLSNYTELVAEIPDFISTCEIPSTYPQYLDFWFSYNLTNQYDYQVGPIGYQESYTLV